MGLKTDQYWKKVRKHNTHNVRMLLRAVARGDEVKALFYASKVVERGIGANTASVPQRFKPLPSVPLT